MTGGGVTSGGVTSGGVTGGGVTSGGVTGGGVTGGGVTGPTGSSYDGGVPTAPPVDRPRFGSTRPAAGSGAGWGALLASAALALVGLLAGCTAEVSDAGTGGTATPGAGSSVNAVAPSGQSGLGAGDRAAIDAVLSGRELALATRDRSAYAATVADPASPDGQRQLAAFDTAVDLGLDRLGHTQLSAVSAAPDAPARAGGATAQAVLRYRVVGVDTEDRTATATYRLEHSAGRWLVASESPTGPGSTAPWLALPGAAVDRTDHAIVAGTVERDVLADHAAALERARADLARTWTMPDTVLVLAPATSEEASVLLGRTSPGAPVAATTEGPVGRDGTATGDRVVLDPGAFARLSPAGRQVVLAHELTHVAVRATVPGRAEPWVAEGYADHLGYGYAGLPVSRLTAPLVAAVRSGSAPVRLPGAAEVDPANGDIEVAYLASWQAVELIADRNGEAALRRFVVAASSTGSDAEVRAATDRALREVLGTTREDLTREWRERLRSLAS